MNPEEIAKKIDHTLLKPNIHHLDFRRLFRQVFKYNFRAVCINQGVLDGMPLRILKRLKRNNILIAVVVDFPLGQGGYINKHFAATLAKAKGADEIDVVWNIGAFLDGYWGQVLSELKPLTNVLPTKVIVETGYLIVPGSPKKTKDNLQRAAELVKESGAFCIKTSTGHEPKVDLLEKAEHIRIFKEIAPDLTVKAAGGIKTFQDVKLMIGAGADIIGTSSGADIMKELRGD